MKRTRARAALALLLLVVVPGLAGAVTEGRISGVVVDEAGNPVADAVVTVTAREADYEVQAETNKKGKFNLAILDATRTYDIRIEKLGFYVLEEELELEVGGVLRKTWRLHSGDSDEMRGELERIDSRNKAAKIYNEGAKAYEAGNLEAAIAKMEEAIAESPDLVLAHATLARMHLEAATAAVGDDPMGHYEAALDSARKVEELAPEEMIGGRMAFDALWGLGRHEEAETLLERLVAEDPGEATAARVFNVGVGAVKAQDLEKARSSFQRAAEIYPELKEAYLNLAHIDLAQGEFESALANAERFLELAPADSRGLGLKYDALLRLGRKEEADAAFAVLKETDPQRVAESFYRQGNDLWNRNQPAAAAVAFKRVLEVAPDHARAHFQLGLAYASTGQIDLARQHFQRFVDLAPDDPEAETARAMLASLQ